MVDKLVKVKRCYGCGAFLQSTNEEAAGYIPEKFLESEEIHLCQRCFKTQHYSADKLAEPIVSLDFMKIIADIKKKNALIFYVVDVFNFESSFNHEINKALKGLDIVLVANKFDLLPKSTKEEKIRDYFLRKIKESGLIVKDVIVASSTKNYNINEVIAVIDELDDARDVYFIGAVSSGKSSLIKTLLKNFKNETSRYITTSIYPNTTLAVQEIPLTEKATIYDTPGISINNSLLGKAEKEVVKIIVPRIEIKPVTYQLSAQQSIIIGGVARLDFMKGSNTSFTFYFAADVKLTRSQTRNADKVFDSLVSGRKTSPITSLVSSMNDLDAFEFMTEDDKKYDVSWNGLGFVSFKGVGRLIRIYVPRGVAISYNESKM